MKNIDGAKIDGNAETVATIDPGSLVGVTGGSRTWKDERDGAGDTGTKSGGGRGKEQV